MSMTKPLTETKPRQKPLFDIQYYCVMEKMRGLADDLHVWRQIGGVWTTWAGAYEYLKNIKASPRAEEEEYRIEAYD